MTLDSASLMSLLTGDPTDRDARLQQLLLQSLGGTTGGLPGAATEEPSTDAAPASTDDALARLRSEVSLIEREFGRVSGLLADVGAALGACPRCLGTEENCPICAGAGVPGSGDANAERFDALVAPAVRRIAGEVE
jgi:hypothetical protein